MAEMEDRWLSVDEIGKCLGVSSDTVCRWIDKHNMPPLIVMDLVFGSSRKTRWTEWVKAGDASDKARQDKSE